MSDYLDPNNEELLKDFFAESETQLEALEQNILVLENDTRNADAIDELFRAAHTLKGASATVQMTELAEFTHVMEDVLDDIRAGKLVPDGGIVDVLLDALDIIKAMLSARADGGVFGGNAKPVIQALQNLKGGGAAPAKAPVAAPSPAVAAQSPAQSTNQAPSQAVEAGAPKVPATGHAVSEYELLELKEAAGSKDPIWAITVTFDESNPMNTVGGIQVFAALKKVGTILKTNPEFDKLYEDIFFPEVVYYVSSTASETELKKRVTISDVTIASRIEPVIAGDAPAAVAGAEAVTSTPAAAATPAPAVEAKREPAQPPAAVASTSNAVSAPQVGDALHADHDEDGDSTDQKVDGVKKSVAGGSVLRVESKRIDDLLNLVSETVINKATFNQITNQFSDNLAFMQQTQNTYRQTIKDLFDSLPEYLERIEQGIQIKDVRKEILDKYGGLLSMFDPVQSSVKTTIAKFRNTSQNLGRITSELQEGVMRIRMVPISQIFSRFPRLVRDLSKSLGKKVNLKIEGEDTELDKSVIEDLLDPLIHCVRNSLDHGIESAEERRSRGKPEEGTLKLKASNEGNMILIEISDDGKGIDVETIKNRAVERGIIHPSKILSDVEAYNLIFEPGFSTAKQVSNISGRGVGLDVVRKQIEKLNGNVSVDSTRGRGTRFTIKIPLTLAIIQGLLVKVGSEIYAIPITAVLDSHRIKPSEIRRIDNYEVFNVREDVISLMRLNRIFNIPTDEQKDYYFVVIVGSGEKKMGLIVDSLIGEEDVVIKPLRDHFTNAPGIAGANITGDGTVSLIIDVSQLLELGQRQEREARSQRSFARAETR